MVREYFFLIGAGDAGILAGGAGAYEGGIRIRRQVDLEVERGPEARPTLHFLGFGYLYFQAE